MPEGRPVRNDHGQNNEDNKVNEKIMSIYTLDGITPNIDPSAFIAPNATVIGNVIVGKNSSVWFNTVIRADFEQIRIGEDSNIQDLTMCHADTGKPLVIGNRVTVGHNCVVHGCIVEDDCLIGMGVVVMNGAVVGKGSIVAAGSVVLENTVIPPNSLVTGAPAKVKRSLDETSAILMRAAADVYRERAKNYIDTDRFVKIG
jgi:carbonic anhydrase/acetyltransferase-like protein (isoleucine patch superfamily)